MSSSVSPEREGLTRAKVSRFLALPFSPSRLKTFMKVKRFEEIPINKLQEIGLEGILIDADGTLTPHHQSEFSQSVINHVRSMLEKGFKVAIYTNAWENRFKPFLEIGAQVVANVPAKPDPRGFQIAMTEYLDMDDPSKVCMIGDSYITDGGAVDAGMKFIHVRPIKGNEPFFHSATRFIAYLCAKIYG